MTPQNDEVAVLVMELGQVLEVRAVDTGDERQRDEDGGKDRQHLHDVVHSVADHRVVDVERVGKHLAIGVDGIGRLDRDVVQVLQERAGLRTYQIAVQLGELQNGLSRGRIDLRMKLNSRLRSLILLSTVGLASDNTSTSKSSTWPPSRSTI